ncbi:hypothetical protein Ddye_017012 [Dipteronia dyeriana]|uniref:Reverse transcriptase n=1 Tax=Dipteronia dyeriana TaxID=168575 RepID=A0AAD9U8I8_9ROSI|nr:hypothetical protein Ddye_017012 [Dipteronia dyeriana]
MVHISQLQLTDDTILFLQPRLEYILNARRILRCFELASGLRTNFHKSCLVRMGKQLKGDEVNWAATFRCVETSLPITYLGLPLGGRPYSKIFWKSLVSRIENRLAPWRRIFLNKGRRLVLIKAVMASIPTYYLSIFQIPVSVAQKVESLQRIIFFG